MIPRDLGLERELTHLACLAGELPLAAARSINAFADHRAHPGGVRADLNADIEAAEELSDCRNYLLWGIIAIYPQVLEGVPEACSAYERRMRALSALIRAWMELHTDGA